MNTICDPYKLVTWNLPCLRIWNLANLQQWATIFFKWHFLPLYISLLYLRPYYLYLGSCSLVRNRIMQDMKYILLYCVVIFLVNFDFQSILQLQLNLDFPFCSKNSELSYVTVILTVQKKLSVNNYGQYFSLFFCCQERLFKSWSLEVSVSQGDKTDRWWLHIFN